MDDCFAQFLKTGFEKVTAIFICLDYCLDNITFC